MFACYERTKASDLKLPLRRTARVDKLSGLFSRVSTCGEVLQRCLLGLIPLGAIVPLWPIHQSEGDIALFEPHRDINQVPTLRVLRSSHSRLSVASNSKVGMVLIGLGRPRVWPFIWRSDLIRAGPQPY